MSSYYPIQISQYCHHIFSQSVLLYSHAYHSISLHQIVSSCLLIVRIYQEDITHGTTGPSMFVITLTQSCTVRYATLLLYNMVQQYAKTMQTIPSIHAWVRTFNASIFYYVHPVSRSSSVQSPRLVKHTLSNTRYKLYLVITTLHTNTLLLQLEIFVPARCHHNHEHISPSRYKMIRNSKIYLKVSFTKHKRWHIQI